MGDDRKWKRRLPTRIYNYNYKVSEGYYKPQTDYLEEKQYVSRTTKSPPKHQSYAERFATAPWYGTTKGLPYCESQSGNPLIKLADRQYRSNSLLREMKDFEEEGLPLSVRASRRKKRFEEEEEMLGIRNRHNSLDSNKKLTKVFQDRVKQKIHNLDEELMKSTRTAATIDPPTKWNYDLDRPGAKVRHFEESYTPYSGSAIKRSTHSEYSSSISKPPVAPSLRTRNLSGGGAGQTLTSRVRINGSGDFSSLPRSSRRSSANDEELSLYSNRAPRLREARKVREANDFSDDISKLVDKMRIRKMDVDPLSEYAQGRHSRSSSMDRTPHRRGSKTSRYVYGIGKI